MSRCGLILRCVSLAAILALALASGCKAFRPQTSESDSLSSPSDVRQASFDSEESEPTFGLDWEDFYPDNFAKTAKRLVSQPPNKQEARKAFDQADASYRQAIALPEGEERRKLLLEAAGRFTIAAEKFPNSALEQDSLFKAGESYFYADYYWEANRAYEKLIKAYPNNRYLDTVEARRFSIAKYWLELTRKEPESLYTFNLFDQERPWRDTRGHGLHIFDKMRTLDDPTGRLADDATLAAGNEYFAVGKFYKADEYYTDLRKTFPTSEHQFLAHFLGLKAKLKCYIGPDYSAAALDEGEKLIRQMRRAFPQEAAQEKEFLDRAAAEIRYRKAEKLWRWGEYYDRRKEYRAAEHYYQRIVREYDDTQFAQRAATRLPEIEGQPPVPPQKLAWLVKLIPSSDKIQPMVNAAKKTQPQDEDVQQASGQSE